MAQMIDDEIIFIYFHLKILQNSFLRANKIKLGPTKQQRCALLCLVFLCFG